MDKSRFSDFRDIAEFLASNIERNLDKTQLEFLLLRSMHAEHQRVRDTYQACLGRLPDPGFATKFYRNSAGAAAHLADCLRCEEFLGRLIELLTSSYQSAPRRFFLHIPKTGGSSIKVAFDARGEDFVWDTAFTAEEGLLAEKGWGWLYKQIGLQHLNPSRPIVFAGHMDVQTLLRSPGLVRSHDRAFTVVRRPQDAVVSALNYAFTVVLNHRDRYDAGVFRSWIQEAGFSPPRSREEVSAAMIEATLFSRGLVEEWSKLLVRYLSPDGAIQGVLGAIVTLDMHVVDVSVVNEYALSEFNLELPRENRSEVFVPDFESLSRQAQSHILGQICPEDLGLYEMLRTLMGDKGVLIPHEDIQLKSEQTPYSWRLTNEAPSQRQKADAPLSIVPNESPLPQRHGARSLDLASAAA
jgi:hypothetical protein